MCDLWIIHWRVRHSPIFSQNLEMKNLQRPSGQQPFRHVLRIFVLIWFDFFVWTGHWWSFPKFIAHCPGQSWLTSSEVPFGPLMPKEKAMESVEKLRERERGKLHCTLVAALSGSRSLCSTKQTFTSVDIKKCGDRHVLATDGSHRTPAARSHGELVAESAVCSGGLT